MLKRFLAVLFIVVFFVMGCSTREPANTAEDETGVNLENTPSSKAIQVDDIPLLLRKPEQWGNTPNFMAVRVGGEEFKLSSLKGKVILLNFWSVDCPACKMQVPILEQLYKKYNSEGLEIVGVCLDRETAVQRFTKSVDMNYILILVNQEIANKYGRDLRFLPFSLIIDQQGNVAQKHVGLTYANVLEKEIKELLEKTENRTQLE